MSLQERAPFGISRSNTYVVGELAVDLIDERLAKVASQVVGEDPHRVLEDGEDEHRRRRVLRGSARLSYETNR